MAGHCWVLRISHCHKRSSPFWSLWFQPILLFVRPLVCVVSDLIVLLSIVDWNGTNSELGWHGYLAVVGRIRMIIVHSEAFCCMSLCAKDRSRNFVAIPRTQPAIIITIILEWDWFWADCMARRVYWICVLPEAGYFFFLRFYRHDEIMILSGSIRGLRRMLCIRLFDMHLFPNEPRLDGNIFSLNLKWVSTDGTFILRNHGRPIIR